MNVFNLFIAIASGVLPAGLWLLFWLEEDRLHPESRRYVLFAFIGGIVLIPIALILEIGSTYLFAANTVPSFALWAAIEEVGKFLVAALVASRIRFDEPVDAVMYMISVAMGFAGIENTLFILGILNHGSALSGVVTANIRFLGSTLVHVVGSGTIGAAWALSLTHRVKAVQRSILGLGVILSIGLHTLFNFFILNATALQAFATFAAVWILVIVLLLVIEHIKHLGGSASLKLKK